jgi:hypothetical protein
MPINRLGLSGQANDSALQGYIVLQSFIMPQQRRMG